MLATQMFYVLYNYASDIYNQEHTKWYPYISKAAFIFTFHPVKVSLGHTDQIIHTQGKLE